MPAIAKCQYCGELFEAKRSDARYHKECYREIRRVYLHEYDHKKRINECPQCGKPKCNRAALCRECNNKAQPWRKVGEENANWKGGRTKANGYVYIRVKRIPRGAGQGYKAEHHLVWEALNGQLPKNWIIHHLNGIRHDNRIENLMAMPRKSHSPRLIVEPYQRRIRELEQQLSIEEQ